MTMFATLGAHPQLPLRAVGTGISGKSVHPACCHAPMICLFQTCCTGAPVGSSLFHTAPSAKFPWPTAKRPHRGVRSDLRLRAFLALVEEGRTLSRGSAENKTTPHLVGLMRNAPGARILLRLRLIICAASERFHTDRSAKCGSRTDIIVTGVPCSTCFRAQVPGTTRARTAGRAGVHARAARKHSRRGRRTSHTVLFRQNGAGGPSAPAPESSVRLPPGRCDAVLGSLRATGLSGPRSLRKRPIWSAWGWA